MNTAPQLSSKRFAAFAAAAFTLLPSLAYAHPGHGQFQSWADGFNHPLHGWDHLVAMIAVGMWAAQQSGKAAWALPLTFLAVMGVGGAAGALGFVVPGAEIMIGLSVVVLGLLVIARTRLNPGTSVSVVALFAFFHGYAHGLEMPGTAQLATFGLGFLAATALLHGMGFVTIKLARVVGVTFGLWRRKA